MNLPSPAALLYALLAVTAVLIAIIVFRPSLTRSREGKVFAFVAFCILPILGGSLAASTHIDRSKQTKFCLNCHIMEPYGKSLYIDNADYVPAAHFQNHRIPADEACYTCHTDYALYGGVVAKLRGLRHIYIQYFGHPPKPEDIKLYTPFNNRECLHCHLGARSFDKVKLHTIVMPALTSNKTSCLAGGCHDTVHNVGNFDQDKFWSPTQ